MVAPLGSRPCPVLGCRRERHTSPTGIRYGRCLRHSADLLSRAFTSYPDPRQGAGAADFPPAHGSGPLLGVELASTVATRGG